jgi:choline dehydrogenase-like flavoprotein
MAPEMYVDDIDCPYVTAADRPFVWVRARQLGGRMIVPGHGRQYYRLGPDDLAPSDGLSPAWPMRPGELDPWYAAIEQYLNLSGRHDRLPWLPDSDLGQVRDLRPDETALQGAIQTRWPHARPLLARFAPPFDALEAAAETGRLLVRAGAIVREIELDRSGNVSGVVWVDRDSHVEHRTPASLVFLCASTLESTRLLLLSRSGRHPNGLGWASGALGRYLMDHMTLKAMGEGPPLEPEASFEPGRCLYLPRFDARDVPGTPTGRGFGMQVYQVARDQQSSYFVASTFAEMLPRPENRVTLDVQRRDKWDIPVLRIDCTHGAASPAHDWSGALQSIAELAGATLTSLDRRPQPPGSAMHECGTARMGRSPENSVLDPYNQCWDARGLYVTDGASFPSQGTQNPTLTILALTARACDQVLRTKKG